METSDPPLTFHPPELWTMETSDPPLTFHPPEFWAMETSDPPLTFHPPKLWGLDYLFQLNNKMYIRDLLEMKKYPMFPGAFAYKNHPIYKVDILGVVVSVEERAKFFVYAVDDGTGIITASCWKKSFADDVDYSTLEAVPEELKVKVEQLKGSSRQRTEGYELGDLVHIQGKVQIYRERKEVYTSYHKKVDNPNFEVLRMAELFALYKNHYDKPFSLPHQVAQEILRKEKESKTGVLSEITIAKELRSFVHDFLNQSNTEQFIISNLKSNPDFISMVTELQSKAGNSDMGSLLQLVLSQMETEGLIYQCEGKPVIYEVLFKPCNLDKEIIGVLNRDISMPKCAERGVHWRHILEQLRRTKLYDRLQKPAVLVSLSRLELQSDIISTTNNHFMAV